MTEREQELEGLFCEAWSGGAGIGANLSTTTFARWWEATGRERAAALLRAEPVGEPQFMREARGYIAQLDVGRVLSKLDVRMILTAACSCQWSGDDCVGPDRTCPVHRDPHTIEALKERRSVEPVGEHPSVGFYRRLLAIYEPADAIAWMQRRHNAFRDEGHVLSAMDMMEQGRAAEVDAEIQSLETGAYV